MTADKERKRAISCEAARRRRKVESDVFGDLCRLLPLKHSVRAHLDKPSIIRLTLSYIRMHTLLKDNVVESRHFVNHHRSVKTWDERRECKGGREEGHPEELEASEEMSLYLKILEGFLMIVSSDGDIIFLSDNVTKHMGLTHTELMGHSIFEYIHPCDHDEVSHNLRQSAEGIPCVVERDFVMRIKSGLTHRGRSTNVKSATWKVLHCQGTSRVCVSRSSVSWLLLICRPLPLSHTLLSSNTFTSQHSMDMRFTSCDWRVTSLLGYSHEELLGRSIYKFCHTLDINCLQRNHLNLCLKTQSVSGQYRMLVKGGGYVWVESHSAVIPSVPPSKQQPAAHQSLCILCVTYVLSGVEEPSLQLSLDQIVV